MSSKINFSDWAPDINLPSTRGHALSDTIDSALEANVDLATAANTDIEKRGFTYPGDSNNSWGLRSNFGLWGNTGFLGGAPFYGRGPELFSLQPFGLGTNSLIGGMGGISPSIFSSNGAGVRYSKTTHLAHMKMAYSVEAYKGFGIIKNVIDLMCNFASEGIRVVHPKPNIQKFYQRWFEAVDMQGRVKDIFRAYYKTANVFIYTTLGKLDDISYNKMKSTRGRAKAEVSKDTYTTNDPDIVDNTEDPALPERKSLVDICKKTKQIPWRYTILNPFQMDLRGSRYFGESEWVFIPDEESKARIQEFSQRNYQYLDETEINIPLEFLTLNKEGNAIILDQAKLWPMHYMKDDHEEWADPMVWPVMNDIMYKNQLRSMDMSVANSVINAITIFKLGDMANGFIAPKEHYKKLSEMLRTPTYSHNIIWNDAIKMESNYPPIERLLSIDKYKSVDKDILAGLGVPGVLIGADGGSFSTSFLQVRTLLERLEEGRREVVKWITSQLRLIAEVMGHREIPSVKFGQMSLRDEQAEKALIIQLLDRNIISAERVHEVFDIETQIEIERLRREQKLTQEEDILQKFGPFKDPMNVDMTTEDQMNLDNRQKLQQMNLKQKLDVKTMLSKPLTSPTSPTKQTTLRSQSPSVIKKNGRPSGTKGIPQKKQRQTKPKGMGLGELVEYEKIKKLSAETYEIVEDTIFSAMRKLRNVNYNKALSVVDRNDANGLVLAVYSNIDIFNLDTENLLNNYIMNEDYHSIYSSLGEPSDLENTRENRIVAMALYRFGVENA